jgi:Holliday junction resolvasome RuvABC endonuclease subunit
MPWIVKTRKVGCSHGTILRRPLRPWGSLYCGPPSLVGGTSIQSCQTNDKRTEGQKMIYAIGIDAAFSNMGLARVAINQVAMGQFQVECLHLSLVVTSGEDKKVVRKSSDSLRRAKVLHDALKGYVKYEQIAFAEVPSGSQSAPAARALGIAVGVLASCPVPVIEVSPMEVKRLFGTGKKGATKAQIIEWAVAKWPDAPWLRYKGKLTQANEHLADALATVMAGIQTPEFQRMMALNHATTGTHHFRSAFNLEPINRVPMGIIPVAERSDKKASRKVVVDPGRPNGRQRRTLI